MNLASKIEVIPKSSSIRPSFYLAADDWGISPGVNRGILELAEAGLIKKVSAMSLEPYFEATLPDLLNVEGVQVGLHFDLTYHDRPDSEFHFKSPGQLMKTWLFADKSKKKKLLEWVRLELIQQIKAFHKGSRTITHIDGHHHIHILPGLIEGISDILKENKILEVRVPLDWSLALSSRAPLIPFSLALKRSKIMREFNFHPFAYPSAGVFTTPERLQKYLNKHSGYEVLCHPAAEDDFAALKIADSYTSGRVKEYLALTSILP